MIYTVTYYSDDGHVVKEVTTSAEDLTAVIEQLLEVPSAQPPQEAAEVAISVKKLAA